MNQSTKFALHIIKQFCETQNIVDVVVGVIIDIQSGKYPSDSSLGFCTVSELKAVPFYWTNKQIVEHMVMAAIGRGIKQIYNKFPGADATTLIQYQHGPMTDAINRTVATLGKCYGQGVTPAADHQAFMSAVEQTIFGSLSGLNATRH